MGMHMADEAPQVAATETTEPEQVNSEQPTTPTPQKPTETVDFWKSKAREQEARAKSNADAARRLQEIEDAQKTEAQRNAEALAKLQKDAAAARAEATRYKVAAAHGIGPDMLDLLGDGDEESLTARAERLAALNASASQITQLQAQLDALTAGKPMPPAKQPVANLRPGATPVETPIADDAYPSHWITRSGNS